MLLALALSRAVPNETHVRACVCLCVFLNRIFHKCQLPPANIQVVCIICAITVSMNNRQCVRVPQTYYFPLTSMHRYLRYWMLFALYSCLTFELLCWRAA